MDKLYDLIDFLKKNDKVAHVAIGVLTIVCLGIVGAVHAAFGFGPAASAATAIMGAGLEGYQKVRGGTVSLMDGVATAAPGPALWGALSLF